MMTPLNVQEFEEELAAAEVKEEGGAEGGADAAGLGVETKRICHTKIVYFWWRHSTDVNSPLSGMLNQLRALSLSLSYYLYVPNSIRSPSWD
jgi:hypothetical protein